MNPSSLNGLIMGFSVLIGILCIFLSYLLIALNKLDQANGKDQDNLKMVGTDKPVPKKEAKLHKQGNKP